MFLRLNPATAKPTKMTQRMELAITNGNYEEFLEEFEKCGTPGIDNLDDLGRSALFIAVSWGKDNIAKFLMEHHADPFVNKNCKGAIKSFDKLLLPNLGLCSEDFIKKSITIIFTTMTRLRLKKEILKKREISSSKMPSVRSG